MSNEIKIFENAEFGSVRTTTIDNEPWFVGKDVADILGYTNPSKALSDHVDDEDKLNNESLSSLGQRGGWLINESGLYSLILSSKLPKAKEFKCWVTSEVLPSIRKHGAYMTPETIEKTIADPDYVIGLITALKEEQNKCVELREEVTKQKPLVDFAKTIQSTDDNILVRECSKLASNHIGIDIGEKGLYQKLRDWKLILKTRNEPTKLAQSKGLLHYTEYPFYDRYGKCHIAQTTKVTPKGQKYIIVRLIRECAEVAR